MAGPALLSRKPQLAQDTPHRGHVQALGEPLLANPHQVLAREGRKPACLWVRAGEHDAHELSLLLGVELRRASITRQVGEPIQPVLVIADNPVAQRLAIHTSRPSRLPPVIAIERASNRQDAPCNAGIALAFREFAQHRRSAVAPDR